MKLNKIKSVDREVYIFKNTDNKKVLHIGCSDMPFTESKVKKGTLLHQRIMNNSNVNRLAGVDISKTGISLMQESEIDDLHVIEPSKNLCDYFDEKFDIIIAGEVLEHVSNMGIFLDSIKSVCDDNSLILITVPNFAPIKRIFRLFWFNEEVLQTMFVTFQFQPYLVYLIRMDLSLLSGKFTGVTRAEFQKLLISCSKIFPGSSFFQMGFACYAR